MQEEELRDQMKFPFYTTLPWREKGNWIKKKRAHIDVTDFSLGKKEGLHRGEQRRCGNFIRGKGTSSSPLLLFHPSPKWRRRRSPLSSPAHFSSPEKKVEFYFCPTSFPRSRVQNSECSIPPVSKAAEILNRPWLRSEDSDLTISEFDFFFKKVCFGRYDLGETAFSLFYYIRSQILTFGQKGVVFKVKGVYYPLHLMFRIICSTYISYYVVLQWKQFICAFPKATCAPLIYLPRRIPQAR